LRTVIVHHRNNELQHRVEVGGCRLTGNDNEHNVAAGIAAVETDPDLKKDWSEKFRWLLDGWKFVPGGRILTAAGTDQDLTFYNCFSGDTRVQTDTGLYPIRQLEGKTVLVLSQDGVYREAEFRNFGEQRLYEVVTKKGDVFFATAGHEWVVTKPKGGREKVTTLELEGRNIPLEYNKNIYVDVDVEYDDWLEGVRWGYAFGDGTIQKYNAINARNGWNTKPIMFVPAFTPDNKAFIQQYYEGNYKVTYQASRDAVVAHGLPLEYKTLPNWEIHSKAFRIGFIAGLIAAAGHVDARGSVIVHQSSLETLSAIRDIASSVGIASSSISLVREKSPYSGEYAPSYRLQFVRVAFATADNEANRWLLLRNEHIDNWNTKKISREKRP
jgi:hypothetical protein